MNIGTRQDSGFRIQDSGFDVCDPPPLIPRMPDHHRFFFSFIRKFNQPPAFRMPLSNAMK